jgi:NTP pyrophosphatase (non-canonical NTP hydrolase)
MKEIVSAMVKHRGRTLETEGVTQDRRLRILTEEIGEVARSIEDIEQAIELKQREAHTVDTATLEDLRRDIVKRKRHLQDELAQVAATALRWLAREIAQDQARDAGDTAHG